MCNNIYVDKTLSPIFYLYDLMNEKFDSTPSKNNYKQPLLNTSKMPRHRSNMAHCLFGNIQGFVLYYNIWITLNNEWIRFRAEIFCWNLVQIVIVWGWKRCCWYIRNGSKRFLARQWWCWFSKYAIDGGPMILNQFFWVTIYRKHIIILKARF